MENATIEKIENTLGIKVDTLALDLNIPRSTMYAKRQNKKREIIYKLILLGYRLHKSPLKLKEILGILEAAEKIKGK